MACKASYASNRVLSGWFGTTPSHVLHIYSTAKVQNNSEWSSRKRDKAHEQGNRRFLLKAAVICCVQSFGDGMASFTTQKLPG